MNDSCVVYKYSSTSYGAWSWDFNGWIVQQLREHRKEWSKLPRSCCVSSSSVIFYCCRRCHLFFGAWFARKLHTARQVNWGFGTRTQMNVLNCHSGSSLSRDEFSTSCGWCLCLCLLSSPIDAYSWLGQTSRLAKTSPGTTPGSRESARSTGKCGAPTKVGRSTWILSSPQQFVTEYLCVDSGLCCFVELLYVCIDTLINGWWLIDDWCKEVDTLSSRHLL